MLAKSKSHWLRIDFHEQNTPQRLSLRMDKNEFKKDFRSGEDPHRQDVAFTGEAAPSMPHA